MALKDDLIPGIYPDNFRSAFTNFYTDSLQKFKETTHEHDPYKDYKNFYSSNSNGYREKEWDTIDWSNSVLCFGCSHIDGIGLSFEDSIRGQIEKHSGLKTVNLAAGGFSIKSMLQNTIAVKKAGIVPKAVVLAYTHLGRWYDVKTKRTFPPKDTPQEPTTYKSTAQARLHRAHLKYDDTLEEALFNKDILDALWKDTPSYSFTWDYEMHKHSGLDFKDFCCREQLPNNPKMYARDRMHGGPPAAEINAKEIVYELQKSIDTFTLE